MEREPQSRLPMPDPAIRLWSSRYMIPDLQAEVRCSMVHLLLHCASRVRKKMAKKHRQEKFWLRCSIIIRKMRITPMVAWTGSKRQKIRFLSRYMQAVSEIRRVFMCRSVETGVRHFICGFLLYRRSILVRPDMSMQFTRKQKRKTVLGYIRILRSQEETERELLDHSGYRRFLSRTQQWMQMAVS